MSFLIIISSEVKTMDASGVTGKDAVPRSSNYTDASCAVAFA
ncbi:MAG: hypothetical protein Q3968_04705 [Clostridiaceae bacterium]|nr:hypothetical protein [Clostridiaceae bacterium]